MVSPWQLPAASSRGSVGASKKRMARNGSTPSGVAHSSTVMDTILSPALMASITSRPLTTLPKQVCMRSRCAGLLRRWQEKSLVQEFVQVARQVGEVLICLRLHVLQLTVEVELLLRPLSLQAT